MKNTLIAIILFSSFSVLGQQQFKVMTYNLLNYGNTTSYCTTQNNNFSTKEGYLKDIVAYYKPDIMGVNEVASNSYLLGRITDSVFNINVGWNYEMGIYSNASGTSLANTIYFNADLFGLANQHVLANQVRDIILFRLYFKAENLAQTNDTAFLNVIVSHLKAGQSGSDPATRTQEVTTAVNTMISLYPAGNYLWMGDFNIYNSNEGAFQMIVNPPASAYDFEDPVNKIGSWNNNSNYKSVHTQSTHTSSNGCASGGGLDDRFDMILVSKDVLNGNEHYSYVSNSYQIPGNDGNHFNGSITSGSNTSAPASMIQTLYNMSDHLPVIIQLEVDQVVGIEQAFESTFEINIPNPISDNLSLNFVSREKQNLKLNILNSLGQVVEAMELELFSGAQSFDIDCSNWNSGLYFISLQSTNGEVLTTKILKI